MTYSIGKTQRYLMILSAVILIANTIYGAFYLMGLNPGIAKPDSIQLIIRGLLHTIPYLYLLIVLFDYFRHKGWKVLQYTLLFAVIMEIAVKIVNLVLMIGFPSYNTFGFSMGTQVLRILLMLMLTIFIFQQNRREHPEVFPLQKYAIALILFIVIGFGIPVLFSAENVSPMFLVVRLLAAIPYLFLIEFALKLKSKEAMVYDSGVNP